MLRKLVILLPGTKKELVNCKLDLNEKLSGQTLPVIGEDGV